MENHNSKVTQSSVDGRQFGSPLFNNKSDGKLCWECDELMTKVIATSEHLITISVASKGCRCSMQFRNRSTQFKMPDYTCYDGKYVAFCFFAVNAFYLTAMAILFFYNRNTNMNQRYETPPQQESNVYVVAPPKGEGEYSITIKEAFKL